MAHLAETKAGARPKPRQRRF